jgi:hypothetical protein
MARRNQAGQNGTRFFFNLVGCAHPGRFVACQSAIESLKEHATGDFFPSRSASGRYFSNRAATDSAIRSALAQTKSHGGPSSLWRIQNIVQPMNARGDGDGQP